RGAARRIRRRSAHRRTASCARHLPTTLASSQNLPGIHPLLLALGGRQLSHAGLPPATSGGRDEPVFPACFWAGRVGCPASATRRRRRLRLEQEGHIVHACSSLSALGGPPRGRDSPCHVRRWERCRARPPALPHEFRAEGADFEGGR